jgi:hypothetical protein
MKRRPGAVARQTALRTPGFDWRTRDDAIAAIRALRDEPLPDVVVAPEPGHPTGNVERAVRLAYADHPVVVAARIWEAEELRTTRTFRVFHYLTYLHVDAARRWRAEQSEPTPF